MESTDVGILPSDNYVLIKPFQEVDNSGMLLPPHLQKNTNLGTVVAVCEELRPYTSPLKVKVKIGDIVYLKDYIDKPVERGEKTYFFVDYEDILGVQK